MKSGWSQGALAKELRTQRQLELIGLEPTTGEGVAKVLRDGGLPPKLQELREKLGRKAKQQKRYRFYSLYGHVCRTDTLEAAWAAVKRNGGSAGVDGVSIAEIATDPEGEARFLRQVQQSLKERSCRAGAVRRVYIPKTNGKLRPLGIPTVRDRVVQAAVLLILEPIFEADFEDCSYGFRPGRSAHQALWTIGRHLKEGYTGVYDADLAGYFDSIPHAKLMQCVRMRVVDRSVLGLIEQWLRAPVVEPPERKGGPPRVKRNDRGTPQGGVLSPLLANVYLHWFDRAFHRGDGPAQWAKAKLVRYADDFVVLARWIGPELRTWIEERLEGWLGLEVNREKTRVLDLRLPGQSLEFLGYRFRQVEDLYGRARRYWNLEPAPKAQARAREALRELIGPHQSHTPMPELIERVNRHLRGWSNYFGLGYPRKAFRRLNHFVTHRLHKHLRRRSQRGWRRPKGVTVQAHLKRLGLITL